jgi:hypothetical protein
MISCHNLSKKIRQLTKSRRVILSWIIKSIFLLPLFFKTAGIIIQQVKQEPAGMMKLFDSTLPICIQAYCHEKSNGRFNCLSAKKMHSKDLEKCD